MREMFFYEEIDSTNDEAKRLLRDGKASFGDVVAARRQTAGRGRRGRAFVSPGGDSVYASFILKPPERPAEQRITAFAAVAVCLAIERTTSYRPGVKWVNDVLADGKKICGILAESVPGAVILGIGVNINLDCGCLPEDLRETAGSLSMDKETRTLFFDALAEDVFRCAAAAEKADAAETAALMNAYRARSVLLGKLVVFLRGDTTCRALCENIADDGALIVRYENGKTEELRTAEISVRLDE